MPEWMISDVLSTPDSALEVARGGCAASSRGDHRHALWRLGWLKRIGLWVVAGWVLVLTGTGCRTPVEIRRVDTSEAGWRVQEGQALWRPGRRYPEMAGELMAATHQDGRCYVQFSKTPFLILQAQTTKTNWAISYPPQKMSFGGPGNPHERFTWLYLQRALAGEPIPSKYHFQRRADGGWRLENARTGESIDGFLSP